MSTSSAHAYEWMSKVEYDRTHDVYGFRVTPILHDVEACVQFIRTIARRDEILTPTWHGEMGLGYARPHGVNRVSFQTIPDDGFRYDLSRDDITVLADQCESMGADSVADRLRGFAGYPISVGRNSGAPGDG